MSLKNRRYKWPGIVAVVLMVVGSLTALTRGQEGGPLADPRDSLRVPILTFGPQDPAEVQGLPDDWTHHHLVFSNPGTEQDAIQNGRYDEWLRIVNDPRYILQQLKRRSPAQGPAAEYVARMNEMPRAQEAAAGEELAAPQSKDPTRPTASERDPRPRAGLHRDWSMSLGSTGKVGAGQYPAKFSFFTTSTPNCANATSPDYVVYNTGLAGSGTQATVVAYNNIYATTCSGAVPSIYWAYNTGGTATLSPVISPSGDQIAYIQVSGTTASLVLLKWANSGGTVASPASITSVSNSSYRGTAAPCYTTITLNGSPNDTNSPPFYDYTDDIIYVGDNSGKLHKFTGVFSGTPAEVLTSGAPWASVSANVLTGPVYDPVSTNVFVGDSGGYLYRVSTAAAVTASAHLTAAGSTGVVDGPIVDSTPATPLVYVFVGDPDSVIQFSATFASGNGGISETIGSSATTTRLYAGSFDNIHYSGSGTTGNLYACGYHTAGTVPRLFTIPINSTFTGTVATVDTPASAAATCSPISEFLDTSASTTLAAAITSTTATSISVTSGTGFATGHYIQIDSEIMHITAGGGTTSLTVARGQLGTTAATHASGAAVSDIHDWIYLSVTASGSDTGCTGACLYNYAVLTTPTAATTGLTATGGTSGIIIDNTSTSTGASQIYFSSLSNETCVGNGTTGNGTGGCAVQASQAAP